jgi:hypothetical protein
MSATMISKKTHVGVVSSGFECGNTATIHVDGTPLLQIPRRGFNVLLLSPLNNTWQSQGPLSFDTHGDDAADDEFCAWLNQLSQNDGTLVAISVCGDAVNKLSEDTRSAIASVLGSKLISKLAYRYSFALVARIGDSVASEAVSGNTRTTARVDAYIDAPYRHGVFVSASSAGFNTAAESFAQVGTKWFFATHRIHRGLNVVEIDETSGVVIKHQAFDTFANSAASESFSNYIGSLPNNRIVVVFVRGEAFHNLTSHAIAASVSLGGDHLDELAFRDSYVLIGCKGWAPCSAYESVPESSAITVSCSFDIPELDITEYVSAEIQTPASDSPVPVCPVRTPPVPAPAPDDPCPVRARPPSSMARDDDCSVRARRVPSMAPADDYPMRARPPADDCPVGTRPAPSMALAYDCPVRAPSAPADDYPIRARPTADDCPVRARPPSSMAQDDDCQVRSRRAPSMALAYDCPVRAPSAPADDYPIRARPTADDCPVRARPPSSMAPDDDCQVRSRRAPSMALAYDCPVRAPSAPADDYPIRARPPADDCPVLARPPSSMAQDDDCQVRSRRAPSMAPAYDCPVRAPSAPADDYPIRARPPADDCPVGTRPAPSMALAYDCPVRAPSAPADDYPIRARPTADDCPVRARPPSSMAPDDDCQVRSRRAPSMALAYDCPVRAPSAPADDYPIRAPPPADDCPVRTRPAPSMALAYDCPVRAPSAPADDYPIRARPTADDCPVRARPPSSMAPDDDCQVRSRRAPSMARDDDCSVRARPPPDDCPVRAPPVPAYDCPVRAPSAPADDYPIRVRPPADDCPVGTRPAPSMALAYDCPVRAPSAPADDYPIRARPTADDCPVRARPPSSMAPDDDCQVRSRRAPSMALAYDCPVRAPSAPADDYPIRARPPADDCPVLARPPASMAQDDDCQVRSRRAPSMAPAYDCPVRAPSAPADDYPIRARPPADDCPVRTRPAPSMALAYDCPVRAPSAPADDYPIRARPTADDCPVRARPPSSMAPDDDCQVRSRRAPSMALAYDCPVRAPSAPADDYPIRARPPADDCPVLARPPSSMAQDDDCQVRSRRAPSMAPAYDCPVRAPSAPADDYPIRARPPADDCPVGTRPAPSMALAYDCPVRAPSAPADDYPIRARPTADDCPVRARPPSSMAPDDDCQVRSRRAPSMAPAYDCQVRAPSVPADNCPVREEDDQHQTDVETLSRLIEESPQFKTVTMALQRAHDCPTNQAAFRYGQTALKTVWRQTLLDVNFGGVNETNMTLLKKVFMFEQGVLAIDSSTDQPVFTDSSSGLIMDVINNVLAAAAAAAREAVPETETMRLMRSVFGQSDAAKIQSELVAVSSLDTKLRLALADKIASAEETLSKAMNGSVAAHTQLEDELQRKLSAANESAELKKKEKIGILSDIDSISQALGEILIHADDLNFESVVNAVDPDSGLDVAFVAIERHFKRQSEIQKGKLGEIDILDALETQLHTITRLIEAKKLEIEQELKRIDSLENAIAVCDSNINSLQKNQVTATTKRDEAIQDSKKQKSRQDMLKQVGRDNDNVAYTKTISDAISDRLRSSIADAADKVDQLRAACIDHETGKSNFEIASNRVNELQRNRRALSQRVESAVREQQIATHNEKIKELEYNNAAPRVKDGKGTKENPNEQIKYNQYMKATERRKRADRALADVRNDNDENERNLAQANVDQTAAQQSLDGISSKISGLCKEIQNMINSQNVEAINAELAAKIDVTSFEKQIDDAKKSIATNISKKTDASGSLTTAQSEVQKATLLLSEYKKRLEDINQQISSGETNCAKPNPVVLSSNEEEANNKVKVLTTERETAEKKLLSINEQLYQQQTYITKLTTDIKCEHKIIAELNRDPAAVSAAILEAQQKCRRDIDHLAADFNEQLNANIAVAGFSTFAAWIKDKNTEIRGQSLFRCLIGHVRGLMRPYMIGGDPDVVSAAGDVSDIQKSSVENLVNKLLKKYPSSEMSRSTALDLAVALINQEYSADATYQQISAIEVQSSTNNSDVPPAFIKNLLKRPSANILLYDASDSSDSDFVELRLLSTSEASDAVQFLMTLSRYASSTWALNSLVTFLANRLLQKPVSEATIEEIGERIRAMRAMQGNVELTANRLQEIIKPDLADCTNPNYELDSVTQLVLRLIDRLFSTRTAILQTARSHIDSTSDELILLKTGIDTALQSFIDKLSPMAVNFLRTEIQRRRDAVLSGSEINLSREKADCISELNGTIDEQTAALKAKKAELRKLEFFMDNKDKQKARAETVTAERRRIEERINQLENLNTQKFAELDKLRESVSNVHAQKETLLRDIQARRDEIMKLKSECVFVERKLSLARYVAEETAKMYNAAEVDVKSLQAKLETTQKLLDDSKAELEEMTRWSEFVKAVRNALNTDFDVIRRRSKLTREYRDVRRGNINDVFLWLRQSLPKLSNEAIYWVSHKNELWASDICSKVLDDKLYTNPNLSLQIGMAFMISGPSLSYSEALHLLRGWAVARLEPLGLALNEDDRVYVKAPAVVPGFLTASMPEPLQAFFVSRIQRCFLHKQDKPRSTTKHWNDQLYAPGLQAAKYLTEMIEAGYGANLMDIVHAFAPTVEIVTGFNFLIDTDVKLPGINFYVTCAGDARVDADVTIDTSAADQPKLKYSIARNGSDSAYKINTGLPYGRDGDDGLDGAAGVNGGHITIRAHDSILGVGLISVKTHGEKGHDGQKGGNGDEGNKGYDTPNADAPDTSIWCRNMTVGISRYPGQDGRRKFPPEGGYPNEISGKGGDGGIPGLGGEGGEGGDVTFIDSERTWLQIQRGTGKLETPLKGSLVIRVSSFNNEFGKDAPGSSGGPGGQPGKRGLDEVKSKSSCFHTTTSTVCSIDVDSNEFQNAFLGSAWFNVVFNRISVLFPQYQGEHYNQSFGWTRSWIGVAMPNVPQITGDGEGRNRVDNRSVGKAGTASLSANQQNSTCQRQQRQQHQNVSTVSSYQKKMYAATQTMQVEEQYIVLDIEYSQRQQQLSNSVQALQQVKEQTINEQQAAVKRIQQADEERKQQEKQLDSLLQQQKDVEAICKAQAEKLNADEIRSLALLASSLALTKEAALVQKEIQTIQIDSEMSQKQRAMIREVVAAVEAQLAAKQAQWLAQKQQIQRNKVALKRTIASSRLRQDQVSRAEQLASLDRLLSELSYKDSKQQQQQQQKQSMQSEADLAGDSSFTGETINLLVRTYFRRDEKGVWPLLKPVQAKRLDLLLSAFSTEIPDVNDDRVVALECLELLLRYGMYDNSLDKILEECENGPPPEKDQPQQKMHLTLGPRLLAVLQRRSQDIRMNHWFCGSLSGVSIGQSPNSSEFVTMFDASLQARYDGVTTVPANMKLTAFEQYTRRVLRNLRKNGPDVSALAAFLKRYSLELMNAQIGKGSGLMALYEGRPVTFLDQISRTLLLYARKHDDTLVKSKLEIILGAARTIRDIVNSLGIPMLVNIVKRKRDMRGDQRPPTTQLLANLERSQEHFDHGKLNDAMVELRSDCCSIIDTKRTPQTTTELVALIRSLSEVANNELAATERLATIARVIGASVLLHSDSDIKNVLGALGEAGSRNAELNVSSCVSAAAVAYISAIVPSHEFVSRLQESLNVRLSTPNLGTAERAQRIVAFCEIAKLKLNGNKIERISAVDMLSRCSIAYALHSDENMRAIQCFSQLKSTDYSELVESVAYDVISCNPELQPTSQSNSPLTTSKADKLLPRIIAARKEAPIMEDLAALAISSAKGTVTAKVLEQLKADSDVKLNRVLIGQELLKFNISDLSEKLNVLSDVLKQLPHEDVRKHWMTAVHDTSTNDEDLHRLLVAVLHNSDASAMLNALTDVYSNASTAKLSNWKDILELSLALGVNTVIDQTVAFFDNCNAQETTLVGYMAQVVTAALRNPATDLETPPEIRIAALRGLLCIHKTSSALKKTISQLKATHSASAELNEKIAESHLGTICQLVAVAYHFGADPTKIGRSLEDPVAQNQVKTETDRLLDEIATLLFDVVQMLPTDKDAEKTSVYGLDVLFSCFHICSGSNPSYLIDNAAAINIARIYLTQRNLPQNIRDASRDLLVRIIRSVEERLWERVTVDASKNHKIIDSVTDAARLKLLITKITNVDLQRLIQIENDRRVQIWRTMLLQLEDLNSSKSELYRTTIFKKVIEDIDSSTEADNVDTILASAVNAELVSLRSKEEYRLPDLLNQKDSWGTHTEKLNKIIEALPLHHETNYHDYMVGACEAVGTHLVNIMQSSEAENFKACLVWVLKHFSHTLNLGYFPRDTEHDDLLPKTIRAVSKLSLTADTDELLTDACRNLCNVLSLCDFQRMAYSQVDLIKRATFDGSYLSVQLKQISDDASKIFSELNHALTADVVFADNQNRACNLVDAVRTSQSFFSDSVNNAVAIVNQTADASLFESAPVNMSYDYAVKAVLALSKVQNVDLATLSVITRALIGQPHNAQLNTIATIVSRSFVQCIKSIVGFAHFAMGRAIDSDYNEELRSTDDEQARVMREYKAASEYDCLQADLNIAFIDFVSKQAASSFENARQEIMPILKDIAARGDEHAKRNLELLEVGQPLTSHYEFVPGSSMSAADRAMAMAMFSGAVTHFVEDIMRIVDGIGPLTPLDGIGILAAIFGSTKCQQYAKSVKDMTLSLEQQSQVFIEFAECIASGIATAPPFAKRGVIATVQDISSLKLESEALIPCGALFMCMRPQLLPGDLKFGSIIKVVIYSPTEPSKMNSSLRASYVLFDGELLRRDTRVKLALIQADLDKRTITTKVTTPDLDAEQVNFALLQRIHELFFVKLKVYAEALYSEATEKTSTPVSSSVQLARDQVKKVLPLMCDFSAVNLGVNGSVSAWLTSNCINYEELMTSNEIALAHAVGDDLAIAACYDNMPSNRRLRNPSTWESSLRKTWLLSVASEFLRESIDQSIQAVEEPVVSYGKNLRLKRLDDELSKIKNAFDSLIVPDLVDNFERIENVYQDIFNFSHYILYLTTTEYILSEMVPEPGSNAKEECVAYEKLIDDPTPKARELVKKIKFACDVMIDVFGRAKLIHEYLIAVTNVWMDANLLDTLISMVSDVILLPKDKNLEGLQYFMWLISKDKPDLLLNCMRYKPSLGSTYFTTVIRRIADCLVSFAESVQLQIVSGESEKEEFNKRLSNIVSRLQSGAVPDDVRGWRYAKLVFTAITQTSVRPGKDVAVNTLLTIKQLSSIVDALELSMKCEAWSNRLLVDRLQSVVSLDSWVPLLENQCIKLSLGYDEANASEEDKKELNRTVAGIVRLTARRGQFVGSEFQSCLHELLRLARPKHLANITEKVASNRYKFSTSDLNTYKYAGKLETSDEMIDHLSKFYATKIQSDQHRNVSCLVGIMQEEINKGGMNEGVSKYFSCDGSSTANSTMIEQRLLDIETIYEAKFATFDKQQILAWSQTFRSERASNIFRNRDIDGINEMLAIFQRVVKCHKKFFMRIPQLMSVILFVDAMCSGKSRLGEIGTGEGKSLIVVFCAAARIFMGQSVDVLSSNKVLAQRDAEEALDWMEYFGISVSNNCDDKAENNEDERAHRYKTNDVIYGEAGCFQRDILLSRHFDKKIRSQLAPCVIVDEVDSMFIDTVGNTLYISHSIENLKHLNDVLVQIWTAVHGADAIEATEANVVKVAEFISGQITTGALLVPNQLRDFTINRIEIWIRSAYQAKMMSVDDQYTTVSSGKRRGEVVVMDLYSGVEQMTTRWSNGLHQFIQLKHNNMLSPESLKAIFMANVHYFKEYGTNITGMTGTIGGQPEREMLTRTYGCDFFRMPRFAEENFYEDPPVLAGNRARWLELVSEEAVNQATSGSNYGFGVSKDDCPLFDVEAAKKDLESNQKKLKEEQINFTMTSRELNNARQRLTSNRTLQHRIDSVQKDLQPTLVLSNRDLDTLAEILDELSANTIFSMSNIASEFVSQQEQCVTWLHTTKESLDSLKINQDESAKLTVNLENAKTKMVETQLKIKNASSPEELTGLRNIHQEQQATTIQLTLQLRSKKDQWTSLQKSALDATKTLLSTCSELLKIALDADDKDVQSLASREGSNRGRLTDLKVKIQAHKDAIEFRGGRAVLIICRNKLDAKDVANTLMNDQRLKRIFVFHGTIEGVTEMDCKTRRTLRTQVPLTQLSPRDIIVSTNIAGRGLSLSLTEPVKKCGGLHVVITFVPENVRVEAQAWGRAARQGDPGSGRFVVCEPNLTALSEDISMAYLLMERNTNEQQRLDIIMSETIPRIEMEKSLFEEFALLIAELEKMNEFKSNEEEQRISLRDRWAFFLEQQSQDLDDIYKDPEATRKRFNRAFQTFKAGVVNDMKTRSYGLIKDPGNLMRIVHAALKDEDYQKAIQASEAIVEADPRFGAYGYYYKALALFGSGTDDLSCKAEAMSLLNNAVILFKRNVDLLQSQSQVVKALNDRENKNGKGTGPDYFTQSNSNTASMIQVHINAAEAAIGYAISESSFNTSAISGDLTKDVFNIITSEPAMQNILLPFRLCGDLEIRVLLDIQDRSKTSPWLRKRTKDIDYSISGNTAKLQGCTSAELEEFEKSNIAFELQLVRRGNTLNGAGDMIVSFPDQFIYAEQKIIRNIHEAAVHKTKSSLNFDKITDRSKLSDWIFAPLIKENEAKSYFSAIVDGDEQEYLIINDDWRSAVMGRWEETGFNGIGEQLRDWFFDLADKQSARYVSTKVALAKAAELLAAHEEIPKLSQDAIDSMICRGIVTKQKLIVIQADKQKLISGYDDVIQVPENLDEDILQKLDLSGYSLLQNKRAAVLDVIRSRRGVDMKIEHLCAALQSSAADASNAFAVLKALMRIAGLDTYLCERLKLNVPKEHREPLDTALERIKDTIELNAWESVGKLEDLRSSLVSQHVILQPQVGPQTFDKIGFSVFLSAESQVERVKKAVTKYCEKSIRDFVKRVKKPNQDEDKTVEQFISDIKDALEKSIGQLVNDASKELKVSLQTLEDNVDKKNLPPELMDFIQSCSEIVFSVEVKKSWWDWNAFAVSMIGLVQVVAGAALLVLTAGAAIPIANALVGEGIGDLIYAAQAGLTGTFSWKEWGVQKAVGMAISIATAGIGAYISRGAQVAKIGMKLTTSAITKAVAKTILGQMLEAAISQLVSCSAEKLAELATKALFDKFQKYFSSWIRHSVMSQNSIDGCKKELTKLVQCCGEKAAARYLTDAVQKSMTDSNLQYRIVGKVESYVMDVAEKLGDNLKLAGDRLKYSNSNKAKLLGTISTVISASVKAGKVLTALQDIVAVAPLAFRDLEQRLHDVRPTSAESQQTKISEDEAAAAAERLMQDEAVSKILAQIQSITNSRLTGFAFNEALAHGMQSLTDRIGKLGEDYQALHGQALALGELRSMQSQETGEEYRERANYLDKEMKKSYKYESPTEDLKGSPNTVVCFMGKRVKVHEIRDWVGDSGLKGLPAADGTIYLMRSDINNYVNSLSVNKRSNLADLHIYAAAAGVDIKLLHEDSFHRSVTKLIRSTTADNDIDGTRPVITLKLVTDSKHPDGHYVMMMKNVNTGSLEPVEGLVKIGNSCAPQQLVFFKALHSGETEIHAREIANKKENIDEFLRKSREMAKTDKRVSSVYYDRKQDIFPDIVGGTYKDTPEKESEGILRRQMALENHVNKFMIVQEKGDFEIAYKKYFGDGTEFAARDVTRYLTTHTNPDGSKIDNSLDWVRNMVEEDPQFLSRSPFDQFAAVKKAGYGVSQVGPWPALGKPNALKAGQTRKTDKSNQWSVDCAYWGCPILDKYAVAVVNLGDDQTMELARPYHLRSSTQLLTSDVSAVSLAFSRLSAADQSAFTVSLNKGEQKLEGYTWNHAGHEYGRMLLVPTEIHQAFQHTGWDSVLRHAEISDIAEFRGQRELEKAMDAYSSYGKRDNEVGKFFRSTTSTSTTEDNEEEETGKKGTSSSYSYTSMTQVWMTEARGKKRITGPLTKPCNIK